MYQDRTKELEDFRARGNGNSNRIIQIMLIYADMNIYGLRAYDAATAFALAIEKAGTTDFGLQKEMFLAIHQRILQLLGSLYIVQTFL
jgi:ionotropic glutamate receptor